MLMKYGSVERSGAQTIQVEIIKDSEPISSEPMSSLDPLIDCCRFAGTLHISDMQDLAQAYSYSARSRHSIKLGAASARRLVA